MYPTFNFKAHIYVDTKSRLPDEQAHTLFWGFPAQPVLFTEIEP